MDSYDIAKRTYDFVMTYMGNRTINMTLVMLFPVGNKKAHLLLIKKKSSLCSGGSRVPFSLSGPLPSVQCHITVNKMCRVHC